VRNRWLIGDFDSLLLQLAGKGTAKDLGAKVRAACSFLHLWGRNLHYENPRLSDPGPGLFEAMHWVSALQAGRSRREATEPPAEARKGIAHG
jgi:hypothetical protein